VTAPFSIARTEVTVSLWQDFVNAYGPLWTGSRTDQRLTGFWIGYSESEQRWEGGGRQTTATNGAWMMGLCLCNWLHNGRVNEPWAFQSGAYDLRDIPVGQISNIVAGRVPMPGATFRLPTRDEWVAAMFYDPDRYGTNQPGYWQYPTSSDTAPPGGWPEDGGQSDVTLGYAMLRPTPVAMYENTQSPWGLLDGLGGEVEATGSFRPLGNEDPIFTTAYQMGVGRGNDLYELFARIEWAPLNGALEGGSRTGFRLVHIPSPTVATALILLISCLGTNLLAK
jgi:formylglycine-generating enzyme required for sulfatase activity